jgi:hypothetical protein
VMFGRLAEPKLAQGAKAGGARSLKRTGLSLQFANLQGDFDKMERELLAFLA